MSDFSRFINRYFLTADIVMDTPLHVGKGESLDPIGTDAPVVKDVEGRPYIPGSSLKGMIRSEFERILRGLDAKAITCKGKRLWACNFFEEKEKCIPSKRGVNPNVKSKEEIEEESRVDDKVNDEKFTTLINEGVCTTCSIFGSTELASRIRFKDATLRNSSELIRISEVRDGIAIDRDSGTVRGGAKFDYEVVPAGARFSLEIIMENMEEWEVWLFLLVLKSWERGEMAIGGKTTRGLGWSKLENIRIERVTKDKLLDYLLSGLRETVSPEDLMESFKDGVKQEGANVAQS